MLLWLILLFFCFLLSNSHIQSLIPTESVFSGNMFPLITAVSGLGVVFSDGESTAIALNQRRLNYRPIILIALISKLVSLPLTIFWAVFYPSVWALVAGTLVGGFVRLVLSHTIVPGPSMKLSWSKADFREIVHFGRWIAVSSVATFVSQQCDVLILGVLVPIQTLGLYSIAKMLVSTGEGLLDQLNASLTLPVLGEVLRKDPSVLLFRYYRFRLPIDVAAGLASGCLLSTGTFIVSFLYDARYFKPVRWCKSLPLEYCSIPSALIGSAFTAVGRTHVNAVISLSKAASLVVLMLFGFWLFGMNGRYCGYRFTSSRTGSNHDGLRRSVRLDQPGKRVTNNPGLRRRIRRRVMLASAALGDY